MGVELNKKWNITYSGNWGFPSLPHLSLWDSLFSQERHHPCRSWAFSSRVKDPMLIARTELGRLPPLQEVAERLFFIEEKIPDPLYGSHKSWHRKYPLFPSSWLSAIISRLEFVFSFHQSLREFSTWDVWRCKINGCLHCPFLLLLNLENL